jgi:N6-adenosine-specific RNA methylase IME4
MGAVVKAVSHLPPHAGLSLPGKITRTSWALPKAMPFEQWSACGTALVEIGSAVQWWLGDWWAYGEHAYGKRIEAVRDGLFGEYEVQTLRVMGYVARNVDSNQRCEQLTFTHHRYVAAMPPAEQKKWLARAVKEGWSSNELKSAIARQAAIDRTKQTDLEAAKLGKFVILYADPPWQYEHPPMGGSNRSIENQYPTMPLEEICALPVGDIAHENAVLFLWATSPKLPECLQVVVAWGFTYRTDMVWVKDKIGMGYHARERHECLLIAKRGELPPPPPEARPDSVVEAPRLEHSAKPPIFYDVIDRMYPEVRKIELFGRAPESRSLWSAWGNQA